MMQNYDCNEIDKFSCSFHRSFTIRKKLILMHYVVECSLLFIDILRQQLNGPCD